MTGLIVQMLGCLIVAAGIGAVVGWLLRHQSAVSHDQQMVDRETELRVKGQALDTALYDSKLKSKAIVALETKVATLESLARSTQQDLTSKGERISALQNELASARQRLSATESEHTATLCRLAQQESVLAAYSNEAREANAARTAAQQELLEKQLEISDLERRLAESEASLKELRRLRDEIAALEPVQGRAALSGCTDGGHVIARPDVPANQLSLQISQSKVMHSSQKDDLKKIPGIGPVLERALNKMGTYSYIQIAKWTLRDIARVAENIGTAPDRIKREKWIAGAKKHHREKYGEKI
ncbi:hypothetical protein [Petrachloros mirabilis]